MNVQDQDQNIHRQPDPGTPPAGYEFSRDNGGRLVVRPWKKGDVVWWPTNERGYFLADGDGPSYIAHYILALAVSPKPPLTDPQKQTHLLDRTRCPHCLSRDIVALVHQAQGMRKSYTQNKCNDCDRHWIDIYTLTDVEDADL